MHFSSQLIALASIAASASAVSHQVAVGESGLVYTPNTTIAAVGDKVVFSFYPRAHNVVQGPYDTPCKSNSTSAIYSGFIPSSAGVANQTFEITINNTDPIWFYCSQTGGGGHCTAGMVGVINPPSGTNETLATYKLNAAKVNSSLYTQPENVQGGLLLANTNSTGTTGSATNSSTTSQSSSSPSATGGSGSGSGSSPSGAGTSATSSGATASSTRNAAAVIDAAKWGMGAVAGGLAFALL